MQLRLDSIQRDVWHSLDLAAINEMLDPCLHDLIDDFYAEIERHPDARKVITGGQEQIKRLKGTLLAWLQ